MQIRPEFSQYIAQRTKLSPQQIEAGSFAFEMNTGAPEDRLVSTAETLETFLNLAQESHRQMEAAPRGSQEANQEFQLLFNSLPKDPKTLAGDPSKANSVLFGLRAKASEALSFGVREIGAKEPVNGMFWAPLHQEVVNIDDFAADSPAMTRPKALLFVDTTPGEEGGTAFIQPLVPLEPKLTETEKTASTQNTVADATQVRPQVSSKLQSVLQAGGMNRSQPSNSRNNDYFYEFYQGEKKVAVLRIDLGSGLDPFGPLIPGITDLETCGTVSFAQHADQEYAEHIQLNGEERKALLATLNQAYKAIPAPKDGMLLSEEEQQQWHHKQLLGAAATSVSALVADGNLGFYERLVSDLDMSGSWLARLKAGERPSNVF